MSRDRITIFLISFAFLWFVVNIIIGATVDTGVANTWEMIINKNFGLSIVDSLGKPLTVGGVQIGYYIMAFFGILLTYVVYRNLPVVGGG